MAQAKAKSSSRSKKKQPRTMEELKALAVACAAKELASTAVPVGALDEEGHRRCMDTIMQFMVNTWAAGYNQGREDQ